MLRKIKFLLLFSFIILLSFCAKSQARITTNDPTVSSGETVTITINSQEEVAYGAIDVSSTGGLTFLSASGGQVNGTLLAFAGTENKTNGIATYKFKAPTVTETKTYKVTFVSKDMGNAADEEIKSSTAIATVTVKAKPTTNTSGGSSSNTGSSSSSSSSSNTSSSKPNSGTSTTTKTPKFTSVNETVYATTEVNVRKSYSTSSAIVGSLDEGESVKRTGIGDNGWSKVTYNGQTAYVYSDYLTKTKPVVKEPEKEEPKNEETTNTKPEENKQDENKNNEKVENVVDNNTATEETVKENEALGLSKLDIAGVNFTEGFNPEMHLYELRLNFFVDKLDVTAEANKADAKVEIIGNENFVEGENNITILVKSADAKETVTYQINVIVPAEVQENPQNNLQFYLICGGIILAAIVSIIVVLAIYKAKNNKILNDEENYKEVFTKNNEEKPKKTKGKHSN